MLSVYFIMSIHFGNLFLDRKKVKCTFTHAQFIFVLLLVRGSGLALFAPHVCALKHIHAVTDWLLNNSKSILSL